MTGKKKHRIVFISGETGCGKTHLAMAFYKQMLKLGTQVYMRDVDSFTEELIGWIHSVKNVDPFIPECEELITLFEEYAKCKSIWYHGWDVLNKKSEEK